MSDMLEPPLTAQEKAEIAAQEQAEKTKFYRSFGVRMGIILLLTAMAISAMRYLDTLRTEHFTQIIGQIATHGAQRADNVFNGEFQRLDTLAHDPRLRQLRGNSLDAINPEIRRVLYEFSLVQNIEDVYLFDPARQQPTIAIAGAKDFAPQLETLLFAAFRDSLPRVVLHIREDTEELILFAQRSREAPVYVAYKIPPNEFLNRLNLPNLSSAPETAFSLFLPGADGSLRIFNNLVQGVIGTRPIGVNDSLHPSALDQPQSYLATLGNRTYHIGLEPLNNLNQWAALALLDTKHTKDYLADWQQFIKWSLIVTILITLFFPTGLYGKTLAKTLQQTKNHLLWRKQPITSIANSGGILTGEHAGQPSFTIGGQTISLDTSQVIASTNQTLTTSPNSTKASDLASNVNVEKADAAMTAKNTDDVAVDEENDNPTIHIDTAELEAQLRKEQEEQTLLVIQEALRRRRSKLLYQPIARTDNGKILMHEVFLRLLDEELEEVPPAHFIPVAEKHDLMSQIDRFVTLTAVEKHFGFGQYNPPRLIINLAGKTADSVAFLQSLTTLITSQSINASNLIFELRTDEIMKEKRILEFLRDVRKAGCKMTIDYTGGGLEQLELFKRMRFDYIKVNSANYADWATNINTKKELIRLSMHAQKLKLPLVLERVETPELIIFARKIGIPALQGYGIGSPDEVLTKEIKLPTVTG